MMESKKLALFDIDGVIYNGHTIFDEIQDQERREIIKKGTWNKILQELDDYKSGRKDYAKTANTMLKIFAESVKGIEYEYLLDDVIKSLLRNKSNFFPYFNNVCSKLKPTHDIYLVTTNFQFTTEAISQITGVKMFVSSIAETRNGKFTGKVKLSLAGNKGLVSNLIKSYGRKGSIAVGDSENDADMLDLVEYPLVMEPNEKLKKIAGEKGWQVVNRNDIADIILSYAR